MAEPEQLTLDLEVWEGPLDVLLSLARAQKVDLRQISVLRLVEQYLAFVANERARLELAADYLVMAAWLAYLKSALLLPKVDDGEEPSPEELAWRLQTRLERLQSMREAGARLMTGDRMGRDVFPRGAPEGLRVVRHAAWEADLYELIAAYGRVSARTRPVLHVVQTRPVMTLEAALARVAALVGSRIEWARIEAFLPEDAGPALRRSALASSFLAALELARQGRVELMQERAFAPLMLRGTA